MKNSIEYAKPTIMPVARMILAMFSRWRRVMKSFMLGRARGRDQEQEHHREAAEDGARDEVGREDGRVPAGQDRRREVERHDRVHRLSTSGVEMPAR
jgi:hypothetical protein